MSGYEGLQPYYGDIHNHCAVGYGHGSIEEAFQNARLQLDFASVTVHAHWPDIPAHEARLHDIVEYHVRGFQRTRELWQHVQQVVEANNVPGEFVTFPGFEWHSCEYGDHNVYFKRAGGEVIRVASLEEMRERLREYARQGIECFLIPHHIGYKQGYRGINWNAFTPEFSPVVEIVSMHGGSEGPDTPRPYLHTMGPLDWRSSYQYGLEQGHVAGVIGSTDHHSAHPGSYGHGRLAVWARELTRDGIWEAIAARRTVAMTGDRIALAFSLNGAPLGSVLPASPERHLEVAVEGGAALDTVEVLRNNRVIHRWDGVPAPQAEPSEPVRVCLEVGWGEKDVNVDWQVEIEVQGGRLLGVEPRFRGHEIVAPAASSEEEYAFSAWKRTAENAISFETRTWGNPTTSTSSTQGMCLDIQGTENTAIAATVNGRRFRVALGELRCGPRAEYLGGFLTPALVFHRAVPRAERTCHFTVGDRLDGNTRDWYTV
ncbi:MAG TPA: DUF3604 domain-containing protein, partial [Aggregatilineales bacterium]|nr:DUF3604 domain-containing protein [Aggregatilineales bacterium]